jgi:quercetin dioxygenase-like cupin family protein
MIGHKNDLNVIHFTSNAVKNASMKALVGKDEGWDSHVLRVLTLEKDGYSPFHKHPWPHINYVLEGIGEIEIEGVIKPVEKGSYAYIPANHMHQFRNKSDQPFMFICIVPTEGHIY